MKRDDFLRVLVASDLHGCYLDRKAFDVFLGVATERPWDLCVLNGDVLDFSQLMSHERKVGAYQREFMEDISLDEEIFITQSELFHPLRKALKDTKIMMRLGNHETRYLSVVESNSKALSELLRSYKRTRSVHLEDALNLQKYKIDLSYNPVDIIGGFTFVHGVKTSKNVAKANLMAYGSGTSGHSHRLGCYTEVQKGKVAGWWESGCLRTTKNVEYLPFGAVTDWSQGYLEVHISKKTGHFFCIPHFIIDYQTIHDGVLYAA